MLVIFAITLLLRTPKPNLVVAFRPYKPALGSLQSSTVMSLRMSIMPGYGFVYDISGSNKAIFDKKARIN